MNWVEDTEHSLSLKPDDGLLLKVEGPLEAAEIKVDAHEDSLPEDEELFGDWF